MTDWHNKSNSILNCKAICTYMKSMLIVKAVFNEDKFLFKDAKFDNVKCLLWV